MFFTISENFSNFSLNLKLLSANSLNLEESKICRLGKALTLHHMIQTFNDSAEVMGE